MTARKHLHVQKDSGMYPIVKVVLLKLIVYQQFVVSVDQPTPNNPLYVAAVWLQDEQSDE